MVYDYQFGPFRIEMGNARLWRGREEIILRPKSFSVLQYLAERPGRLVTREEVLQAVWPRIAVSDAVLTVCIREIRQALNDDSHVPRYIETAHRRGYRFIGTVTAVPAPAGGSGVHPSSKALVPAQIIDNPFRLSTQDSDLSTGSMVGRETEIAQLESWLWQAREGRRQVVFVTGEPGIGKTSVVDAFLTRVLSGPPLWVAWGSVSLTTVWVKRICRCWMPWGDYVGKQAARAFPTFSALCADVVDADASAAPAGGA